MDKTVHCSARDVNYPEARVLLDDGTEIIGKITKIGKFIYFIRENDERKLIINTSKVLYINQDLITQSKKT
jgi:hypothetical protein